LIIKLHITDDLSSVFSNYLDLKEDGLLKDIILDHSKLNYQLDEMKVTDQARFKKDLIKLFVRLQAFIGKEQRELNLEDQVYKKYMENLFYWNNGEAPSLSNLYEDIYSAIYKWNGEIQNDYIGLPIGKDQVRYKVSQRLVIEPYTDGLNFIDLDEYHKFIPNLILRFTNENENELCSINIDFNLYELLIRVKNGYRPNSKDKNNYINFVEFMQKIERLGNQNKEVIIEDQFGDETSRFKLTYNKNFNKFKFTTV